MKNISLTDGAFVYISPDGKLLHDNLLSLKIINLVVPIKNTIKIVPVEEFITKNIIEPDKLCAIEPFIIIVKGNTPEESYQLIKKEQEKIEFEILKHGAKQVISLSWCSPYAYEWNDGFIAELECFMIGI